MKYSRAPTIYEHWIKLYINENAFRGPVGGCLPICIFYPLLRM